MRRILVRHLGNMGDMIFFIPPVLAALKRLYPHSHITFVTAWGFKDKKGRWGKRNQGGFSLHLMMTNPHLDRLIHYHDTKTSLAGKICREDGKNFATWSRYYYEQQKSSGKYDAVLELDFGLKPEDNPIQRMYEVMGLPAETYSRYKIYFKEGDLKIAAGVMKDAPRPRIALLEGLEVTTTRGWDPGKVPVLERKIEDRYGVKPLWFGGKYAPWHRGRPLTLRENIATLTFCDVGIGVLSGPLHFAAAAGLPTLTLYCDHPLHRAAPAFFLNKYISGFARKHRTLLGPSSRPWQLLKYERVPAVLTPAEATDQRFQHWTKPGRQSTKSPLAVLTVDEVMTVLKDMLPFD